MGGGNRARRFRHVRLAGLSPRGRGKRPSSWAAALEKRSIPAWAGETSATSLPPCRGAVYPRVGGGNYRRGRHIRRHGGLSPRGRGKPRACRPLVIPNRSIPAWAGETSAFALASISATVYPRVGGGNLFAAYHHQRSNGLSPRGRGKPYAPNNGSDGAGSIPAWAGETLFSDRLGLTYQVYPRVGGGNDSRLMPNIGQRGLSPRGRGKRARPHPHTAWGRSIPAWAGETGAMQTPPNDYTVYPRVGGGNSRR